MDGSDSGDSLVVVLKSLVHPVPIVLGELDFGRGRPSDGRGIRGARMGESVRGR